MIFLFGAHMVGPGIHHLRQIPIIDAYPAIENAGHYFDKEEHYQLGFRESGTREKTDFGYDPAEQNKVAEKQDIFDQCRVFKLRKIKKIIHINSVSFKGKTMIAL